MLRDLIEKAQNGDEKAMLDLIHRFQPLFKKYAIKLNYEDAYEDIILYYIELIKSFNLDKLRNSKDEVIVSYINVSIINFYKRTVQKLIEAKREIVQSALTEEQAYYVEVCAARKEKTDIFNEFGIAEVLNERECRLIYLIYVEGYTTSEIARNCNKTRQAVNQLKHRALTKMKTALGSNLRL